MSSDHLHTDGEVVTNVSYAFWIMAIINVSIEFYEFVPSEHKLDLLCGVRVHAKCSVGSNVEGRAAGKVFE